MLRHVVGPPEYLGALSIARRGRAFDRTEAELLEYLAGQAVVSIEKANLHETVERQAVTDELTGLANRRAFDEAQQAGGRMLQLRAATRLARLEGTDSRRDATASLREFVETLTEGADNPDVLAARAALDEADARGA